MPEVLVRSVMSSLYEGAETGVRVYCELSTEFEVKVGMHQGSVLFLFCTCGRRCHLIGHRGCASELLYANDLVLVSETIKGLRNKFLKCKEDFEGKGL